MRWVAPVSLVASFGLLATPVLAAEFTVSPDGSGELCTRVAPCALSFGVAAALAGDKVLLEDGVYNEGLTPKNSGTPDAWITFEAAQCALPIIQGEGEAAAVDDSGNVASGVYIGEATYLRFIGIVSRHWDSGFTNGWTGETTDSSNGHIEYINCIGEGNGRTGFAMYSAGGFTVRECISAHNGGSPTHSWSSGVQLYAVQGTADDNLLERNVSFENADGQKNNDGSGFIVDEETQGATFLNNLAFRNGGSCMRLTRSNNTRMINFTCYHNGMNPEANSPTNPGELYWTDEQSRDTTTLSNSIAAASGSDTDPEALRFPPTAGLSNNLTLDAGDTPFFTDPEGDHPDFRPSITAVAQIENAGTASGAPDLDLGLDPLCIVKRDPEAPYQKSWWQYSVDYDYIRSIGGVAQCFHPKPRTGGPDLGAYELSGEPHAFSAPGSCVRPPPPEPEPVASSSGGAGGTPGVGPIDPAGVAGAVNAAGGAAPSGDVVIACSGVTTPPTGVPSSPDASTEASSSAPVAATAPTISESGTAPAEAGPPGASPLPSAPSVGSQTDADASGCACRVFTPRSRDLGARVSWLLTLGLLAYARRARRSRCV